MRWKGWYSWGMDDALSIYIHWPFCAAKCPYCDFNVHVVEAVDMERWGRAYKAALRHYAEAYPHKKVRSVFFGGGTPSLMSPSLVDSVVDEISNLWHMGAEVEVTLEANPTSTEARKFQEFRTAGVNRLSLGIQSINDRDLQFLGRKHSAREAVEAIETARSVFERMTFDLIYALPDQKLQKWEDELREALALAAGHMSLYQLTIERNTPFYLAQARGEFFLPEQGVAADFYTVTQEVLAAAGLVGYEISNHAAPGQESVHNLAYWRYQDYIGVGPGAHGRVRDAAGVRYATRDHQAPGRWVEWVETQGCGAHPREALGGWDQAAEAVMMGLRLKAGVQVGRSDMDVRGFLDMSAIEWLEREGQLCYDGEGLWLTAEGAMRLNTILPHIVKGKP